MAPYTHEHVWTYHISPGHAEQHIRHAHNLFLQSVVLSPFQIVLMNYLFFVNLFFINLLLWKKTINAINNLFIAKWKKVPQKTKRKQ